MQNSTAKQKGLLRFCVYNLEINNLTEKEKTLLKLTVKVIWNEFRARVEEITGSSEKYCEKYWFQDVFKMLGSFHNEPTFLDFAAKFS